MGTWGRLRRALAALVVVGAATTGLAGTGAGAGAAAPAGADSADGAGAAHEARPGPDPGSYEPGSYTGSIDGADYRVEVPEGWNGTLLLYSHGYFPPAFPVEGIQVTNSVPAETWLLDHGYALAASNFVSPYGFQVEQGYADQLALLDWFDANVAEPQRVIATGQSMGGVIATRLGEEHPGRIDGVAAVCAAHDANATMNTGLDVVFAVKVLLAPDEDIELVHSSDPAADTAALLAAVERARLTEEGRARLALVASLNNVTGWWSALQARPTDPEVIIQQQTNWISGAYVGGFAGPNARADLEARLGGNPSTNVGVDYARQVQRSSQTEAVRDAYRRADISLRDDLARLAAAPRIAADPAAAERMADVGTPSGRLRVPLVTIQTVGDGGAPPDQGRWYADEVREHGGRDLVRQLYVDRGQHCSLSAADEVTAVETLVRRIEDRRWPDTAPRRLNATVGRFAPEYQVVLDLSTYPFPTAQMPPAFTRFTPPDLLRPTH